MSDINEMNLGPQWYIIHTYSGYEQKVCTTLAKWWKTAICRT